MALDNTKPKRFNRIRNVVIYSRFDQDEPYCPSFEEQEIVAIKWANDEGYSITKMYRETCSGMLDEYSRPILKEAQDFVHNTPRTLMVVSDYDRLTLNGWDISTIVSSNTSRFVTAEHGYNPDVFFVSIKAATNEEEWRKRIVRMGEDPKAIKWKINVVGRRAFARIRQDGVKRMLKQGSSFEDVAKYYNSMNLGTQEGPDWTAKDVERMTQYFS